MKILTLRISLNETDPEIWRRFQVNDAITFYDLHTAIQVVMGWQFSHLHDFQIDGKTYSEWVPLGFDPEHFSVRETNEAIARAPRVDTRCTGDL